MLSLNTHSKVTSASLKLSFPLDSCNCCSVSLCSLNNAERIQHPNLKMTKLTEPVAITFANEDANLQGIALQNVPITRTPAESSIHTMLVVPKLARHIGELVSHILIQFAIKCPATT